MLPVLRLARKKRNALFLGQIVHFKAYSDRRLAGGAQAPLLEQ